MTLTDVAYLEIERGGGLDNATFELRLEMEHTSGITKSYLMGEQGQYIREIVNQTPETGNFDASRRTGFWIDGGAGDWTVELNFETGLEDAVWGDGSGGTGQSNVTTTDASGSGVKAISRKNVLAYWLAKTKSDSGGQTKLHHGEFTDGNIYNVTGVSAGAFGEPMAIAIRESSFQGPMPDEGSDSFQGRIEASRVALWGGYDAPDWADSAVDAAEFAFDIIPDI